MTSEVTYGLGIELSDLNYLCYHAFLASKCLYGPGGVHQAKKVKPEKVTEFELNQRHAGGIWREI